MEPEATSQNTIKRSDEMILWKNRFVILFIETLLNGDTIPWIVGIRREKDLDDGHSQGSGHP